MGAIFLGEHAPDFEADERIHEQSRPSLDDGETHLSPNVEHKAHKTLQGVELRLEKRASAIWIGGSSFQTAKNCKRRLSSENTDGKAPPYPHSRGKANPQCLERSK